MAKKKLFKSKGNFTIKRLHQSGSYGNIYERDYTTISNTSAIPSGQIPIYASPSFKLSIRGNINKQKKYRYSNWVNNPQSCNGINSNTWTLGCMPAPNIKDSEIVLKPSKTQLTDYVCYGSAYELIKASISDIISKFPAELYFSNTTLNDIGILDLDSLSYDSELYKKRELYRNYCIVENPFAIDIIQTVIPENSKVSSLRYFCETQYDYTIIDNNDNIIVDGKELKKWNENNLQEEPKRLWVVKQSLEEKKCLENGDLIASVYFNGIEGIILSIGCFYYEDSILYLYNSDEGNKCEYRIRPNKEKINDFFNNLDDFEQVLLNQHTNYTANFETYVEDDENGWYVKNKSYKWSLGIGGWNLAINDINYTEYIQNLTDLANGYDTLFTNAIWNNMTHEAISNMDLTEKINSNTDISHNPTKMKKFLNVIGRQFDEIKKYADNIKNTNNVSYDGDKNIPDYFISDTLSLSGWETKSILNEVSDDIITEPIYDVCKVGYKASDANNEFMKRLKLNSKNILSSKGTKRCVEDLLGIFGFHSTDWLKKYYNIISCKYDGCKKNPSSEDYKKSYILKEYVYVANGYNHNIDPDIIVNEVKRINQLKDNYNINGINDTNNSFNEFQGIPVAEVMFGNKTRIVPWFDKNNIYDNDMYFQMKGGWARNEGEADEPSKYECTISKTNFVNNIEELYEISYNYLNNGDIYYVNDEETYYKLININKHNSMEGWTGASTKEINELESIIDNNKGNNPHYGEYDGGQSYFNLMRNFFVSSEFSDVADSDIENKDKYGFIIQRQDDNIKVIDYDLNLNTYEGLRGKMIVTPYNFFEDEISNELYGLSVINSKEFHIIFDKTYKEFIENDILPYLKQIIPSTTIFSYSFENVEEYNNVYDAKINNITCDNNIVPIFGVV